MPIIEDIEFASHETRCPQCERKFDYRIPKPGCNECECCFCSEDCRNVYHRVNGLIHNYDKPLEDL